FSRHRHSSPSIKKGKKRAMMCVSTHKARRATTTCAAARCWPHVAEAGVALAPVISQIEKCALEMRGDKAYATVAAGVVKAMGPQAGAALIASLLRSRGGH